MVHRKADTKILRTPAKHDFDFKKKFQLNKFPKPQRTLHVASKTFPELNYFVRVYQS
jgi:hypothetical protein